MREVSHLFLESEYSRRYFEDWAKIGKMAKSNLKSNSAYCHRERMADAMTDLNKSGLPTGIELVFNKLGRTSRSSTSMS